MGASTLSISIVEKTAETGVGWFDLANWTHARASCCDGSGVLIPLTKVSGSHVKVMP
jgi:hypothetical protein